MTKHVERQIETLKQKILHVGTLVKGSIANAMAALINRDSVLADQRLLPLPAITHRHRRQTSLPIPSPPTPLLP